MNIDKKTASRSVRRVYPCKSRCTARFHQQCERLTESLKQHQTISGAAVEGTGLMAAVQPEEDDFIYSLSDFAFALELNLKG